MNHRVFVDANKLIQFGHDLAGAEAKALKDLVASGLVRVVSTDLTMTEVAKRFAKNDLEKLQEVCRKEVRGKVQQYLGIELPEISREELWRRVFEEHSNKIHRFMTGKLRAKVLNVDDVKPSEVLDDYAHGRGLFSGAGKKDQFPDAFIFARLKRDVAANGSLIVLSQDNDYEHAAAQVDGIIRVASFEKLLKAIGVELADSAAEDLVLRFEEGFQRAVEEELRQYSIDADDVEDAEIDVDSVSKVRLSVRSIYRNIGSSDTYLVYADIDCTAVVSYTHPDWDNGIWDSEDKDMIPLDSVSGTQTVEMRDIPFSFVFEYDPDTDAGEASNATLKGAGYLSVTLHPMEDF